MVRGGLTLVASVCGLLGLAGVSHGGPAPPQDQPGADISVDTSRVPGLRKRMEADLEEIGLLAQESREEGELVQLACILDKRDQARAVMEVSTGELIVLGDSESTPEARRFAVEKLDAAGERMAGLLEAARRCGEDGITGREQAADTTLDAPKTIPVEDPTKGPGILPPPGDDTRPPYVASPSL